MASSAVGNSIALAYGYVQVTGVAGPKFEQQNTGNDDLNYTRTKFFLLGEGPWDSCTGMWIDDDLQWLSENDDTTQFHFHNGYDTPLGTSLSDASSIGGDQLVDSFWNDFPAGINRLTYPRLAYYAIRHKHKSSSYTDDTKNDAASWSDWNPIGEWRSLITRNFDASGNVESFAFTVNPSSHIADVILRRKVQRHYTLDPVNGPSALTDAQKACFSWDSFYEASEYFAELLGNGRPRFSGSYFFNQRTTLRAILDQMSLCCRSTVRFEGGKYYLITDKPRPSYFTLNRSHVQPQTFKPSGSDVASAANHVVSTFRDILIPAFDANIVSIDMADHQNPVVTFDADVPCDADDWIVLGGTNGGNGSAYDKTWQVASSDGAVTTLKTRGLNYPSHVGAGGKAGFLRCRYMERTPEFPHKAHQLAKGVAGVGLPRIRNRVRVDYDFANSTYDQVDRLSRYERDLALGPDVQPYAPRPSIAVSAAMFCRDANGQVLAGVRPRARFTVDDTASYTFAGDYFVDKQSFKTFGGDTSGKSGSDAGLVNLSLKPYDESIMYDVSNPGGYVNVPGSDPGNDGDYTEIPLQDGSAYFWTGGDASGATVSIPSVGINPANVQGWVSPQGTVEANHQLHVIRDLSVSATRKLNLVWSDGNKYDSNIWSGDVGYAFLGWRTRNSVTTYTQNGINWIELTLLGGEQVVFGYGKVSGTGTLSFSPSSYSPPLQSPFSVVPPSGYTFDKGVCLANCRDGIESGDNDAHGFSAWVDASGLAHSLYQDGESHQWCAQYVDLFIFLFKNNKGTWGRDSHGYWSCPLGATAKRLSVGGFSIPDPTYSGGQPANFPATLLRTVTTGLLPLPVGQTQKSLQVYCTPNGFEIVDHPTHGIKECYVDGDLNALIKFEDGEGNVWRGSMGAFSLVCEDSSGTDTGSDDGGGSSSFAIPGSVASPATPGGQTTVQVNVHPDTTSSGIAVTVDASSVGASSTNALGQGLAQPTYTPFSGNINVPSSTAVGTYNLVATATDLQGHTSTANIALEVQGGVTEANIELESTQAGTRFTTHGFNVINGGTGYTPSTTLTIEGLDADSPYNPKTVACALTIDINGSITNVSGGNGVRWYGPPTFELIR